MQIFNRRVIKLHRDRIADKICNYDFIIREIYRLTAKRFYGDFSLVLNLGAHTGQLLKFFSGYKKIINSDISENMLKAVDGINVVLDEEFIPFAPKSFDAVVSVATLHRVNDLPGALLQIHNILKGNGVFVGTLFGVNTLYELKQSLAKMTGGMSPMVYPFVDVKDAGMLMQRAGFHMAVADTENLTINYDSVEQLFMDLRYMGETNALTHMRKALVTKTEIDLIKQQYKRDFADEDGLIPATFEVVTITGMKNVS